MEEWSGAGAGGPFGGGAAGLQPCTLDSRRRASSSRALSVPFLKPLSSAALEATSSSEDERAAGGREEVRAARRREWGVEREGGDGERPLEGGEGERLREGGEGERLGIGEGQKDRRTWSPGCLSEAKMMEWKWRVGGGGES